MNIARVVGGEVIAYPYRLRPDAKRAHPEVKPLPGSWEQCSPVQLVTLEAVEVTTVAQPNFAREGLPIQVDGVWQQNWVVRPPYDEESEKARWDGERWVIVAVPVIVPVSVETHKLLIAMDAAGYLSIVNSLVDAANGAVKIAFERAPYIHRHSPMVLSMATVMWPDDSDVERGAKLDALFVAAAKVKT